MTDSRLLKKDLFGAILQSTHNGLPVITRDCSAAASGVHWLARGLMRREARALAALEDVDGTPEIIRLQRDQLIRSFFDGAAMQLTKPADPAYFKAAARVLRRMHRAGVAHNDLAKEPNFIVCEDGSPAIIDFQLSICVQRRGRMFRLAAREDLRHLLKHKRTYCPNHLTGRERAILNSPSWMSRILANTFKPIYLFVTRRLLAWEDREGAGDRDQYGDGS